MAATEGKTSGLITWLPCLNVISQGLGDGIHHLLNHIVRRQRQFKGRGKDMWYMVNGRIIGRCNEGLMGCLRQDRVDGFISNFVSIFVDDEILKIESFAGLNLCPFMTKKYSSGVLDDDDDDDMSLRDLLVNGYVSYLSSSESRVMKIHCPGESFSYPVEECDYSIPDADCFLFSRGAARLPLMNHQQGPRNLFYWAQMKARAFSLSKRSLSLMSPQICCLLNPQRPIVETRVQRLFYLDGESQSTQMPVIGILSGGGWNQEDSFMVSKAAIERGMFQMIQKFTIIAWAVKSGPDEEKFQRVPMDAKKRHQGDYSGLSLDGLLPLSHKVKRGTILIGKVSHHQSGQLVDHSVAWTKEQTGVVIERRVIEQKKGKIAVIKIGCLKSPEVGDKLSCNGQKGVIGKIVSVEDMVFSVSDGIMCDVLMNPHAFPSRMTVGLMKELMLGTKAAKEGKNSVEGSSFIGGGGGMNWIKSLRKTWVCDGKTGQLLENPILMGLVPMSVLANHFVAQKIHYRELNGRNDILTRQPTGGKMKGGGPKIGTMEKDGLVSHGVSSIIQKVLCESSDGHWTLCCGKCGILISSKQCNICFSSQSVKQILIPYSLKLMMQELQAMHITTKISLS